MKKLRRLSLLLAICMLVTAIAGCQTKTATPGTTASGDKAPAEAGKLFDQPVTLSLSMVEHPTYPYDPDNYLGKKIKELYNVTLDVTAIQDGYYEKLNLDMASGEMTDLIYQTSYNEFVRGGQQGAYVDILEYLDKMPNFKKWMEANKDYVNLYFSTDGELFCSPNLGYGEAGNRTFWLYRKDLFEKHNLSVPVDDDEAYEVSKALKAIYPDSYPICNRSYLGILGRIGVQWDTGWAMYYNNGLKKWVYGPAEDNFLEMLIWHNKMYKDDLIPPNTLTLDTIGWQDYISTDRGFMTTDYIARIDFYNKPMRETNPDFDLQFMPPFKGGKNGLRQHSTDETLLILGLSIASTSKKIDECVKYIDNMYKEEVSDLYTWGVEGESYEVRDGKKYHIGITDGYLQTIQKYGFFQRGHFLLMDPWGMINTNSQDTMNALEEVPKYDHPFRAPFVPFSAADTEKKNILEVNLDSFMSEGVSQFFLGQRPFSEYPDFIKELEGQGMNDLIKLYNDSYQEFLDKLK